MALNSCSSTDHIIPTRVLGVFTCYNECYHCRIQEAKKITKRYRKDIKLLIERLDRHGDGFRAAVTEVEVKPEVPRAPRPASKQTTAKPSEKQNTAPVKKPGPKRKSKADKVCILIGLVLP